MKYTLNQPTVLKMIQLSITFLLLFMGYFYSMFGIDCSFLFYAALLYTVAYGFYVLFVSRKKLFREYRTEILIGIAAAVSVLANMEFFDFNHGPVGLAELFLFLGGTMLYTGKEDMGSIKKLIHLFFRLIIAMTFFMTFLSVAAGVYSFHTDGWFPWLGSEKLGNWHHEFTHLVFGGYYRNGNQLGLNAFVSAALSIYFLGREKHRWFDITNIFFQLIGIVVSGCRSIYLAVIVFALYLAFHQGSKKIRRIIFTLVCAGILFLAGVTIYKMSFYHKGAGSSNILNALTGNRYAMWQESFRLFQIKPWTGIGVNNTLSAARAYLGKKAVISYYGYTNSHNFIMNILAMTGILGFLSFLAYGKKIVYSLRKADPVLKTFVLSILFADLFDIFVVFTDHIGSFLVPLIVGYAYRQYLAKDKPVYFISNVVEEELYREIYTKEDKPGQQAQKFNRLIGEGFAQNGQEIYCLSSVLASPSIVDYTIRKFKNQGMYKYHLSLNIPLLKNLWHLVSTCLYLLFRRPGYVLVDVLSIDDGIGSILASKIMGTPAVGIITDLPEHFSGNALYAKLFYRFVSWCDGYVFLTEYMDEKLNPKHKPWIVMEGLCDSKTKETEITERTNAIVFAGEIDEPNGVMTLVNAFNAWDCTDYDLCYYGSGEAMPLLQKAAEGNPRIHLMGLVLNRELMPVMERASLLVNPRPVHQDFVKYSFPNKLMEYMNTGTYTASSHLACIPEEYFRYIGDLGEGSSEDILAFFRRFETMKKEEILSCGKEAQKFVQSAKNNKIQAERIMNMMKEFYA
ncbi:MAG: O-antigen ligase family protein [Solobacterium sp.]|nr:O-antigen ligase family protein [Solobacterium sp.]